MAPSTTRARSPTRPRIAVVGAGVVGASVAYYLARGDAAVILLDAGPPAGGATGAAFGWINGASGSPGVAPLRQLAGEDWRRVARDLGGALEVRWCGALSWHGSPDETERFVAERAAAGHDIRLVGRAEIAALEPGLVDPPACAAHARADGVTDPAAATQALVRAACGAGAQLRAAARAAALVARGGRVTGVRTGEGIGAGVVDADVVVVAAGTGAAALCRPLGVHLPVGGSPALLVRFGTRGPLVRGVVSTPELEVRQASATVLLAAADHADGPPDVSAREAARTAERTCAAVGRTLRGGRDVVLEGTAVGVRPMPADGLPFVGAVREVDGLYLAALHSGVTLAPTVGRLAAAELLDGARSPLLAACRPERFDAPRKPPDRTSAGR